MLEPWQQQQRRQQGRLLEFSTDGLPDDSFKDFLSTFPDLGEDGGGAATRVPLMSQMAALSASLNPAAPDRAFLHNAFNIFGAKLPQDPHDVIAADGSAAVAFADAMLRDLGDVVSSDSGAGEHNREYFGNGDLNNFWTATADAAKADPATEDLSGATAFAYGARFGYIYPGSTIVGTDAVDLPRHAAARLDPLRAMEHLLFGYENKGKEEAHHADYTEEDARGDLVKLAKTAVSGGKSVSASIAGKLYKAVRDPRTNTTRLLPVPTPRGALEAGALVRGGYAVSHRTGPASALGGGRRSTFSSDFVQLNLRDVKGVDVDTFLRCRFAGKYLPVHSFNFTQLNDRNEPSRVTVVEVDVRPPGVGHLPLEGVAFLETVVQSGPQRGLPVGLPVAIVLTADAALHAVGMLPA